MINLVLLRVNVLQILRVNKKLSLNAFISNSYCSSIFDLIAKRKNELENEEDKKKQKTKKRSNLNVKIYQNENNIKDNNNDYLNFNNKKRLEKVNKKIKSKSPNYENDNSKTKTGLEYIGEEPFDKYTTNFTNFVEDDIYNNKIYLLRYIKQLNIKDDINKYRFSTKYIINNITTFKYNELLFILKVFSKRRYKNLLFLQCTSEYFYWLCKLNKGSKQNISYYLYFCSILNYIPTIKYVQEYLKLFEYDEHTLLKSEGAFLTNASVSTYAPSFSPSLLTNMLKDECNIYHKNVKYLIYVLNFLHKANIRKETYDILLYMCCYYASDLTLKNLFLLLKILISKNGDTNYYSNSECYKIIHKNMERHLKLIQNSDFVSYLNILIYNNIKLGSALFIFVKNYMEENQTNLSSNAVISILKIKKKENYKDTIILKKIVHIVTTNFYDYCYDNILYIVKVLRVFNYFNEPFFFFLFNKYTNNKNCDIFFLGVKENNKESKTRLHTSNTSFIDNSTNTTNLLLCDGKKTNYNLDITSAYESKQYNDADSDTYFKNGQNENVKISTDHFFKRSDEKKNKLKNGYKNKYEEKTNNNEIFMSSFANEYYEIKNKHKKINELTHLPLHLDIQKTKLKIDLSNIVLDETKKKEKKKDKNIDKNIEKNDEHKHKKTDNVTLNNINNITNRVETSKLSYNMEYIEMFIILFIYIGTCGYRNIDVLNVLSENITKYLCLNIAYNNINNSKKNRKKEYNFVSHAKSKYILFDDVINKIKNDDMFILEDKKYNLLGDDKNCLSMEKYNKSEQNDKCSKMSIKNKTHEKINTVRCNEKQESTNERKVKIISTADVITATGYATGIATGITTDIAPTNYKCTSINGSDNKTIDTYKKGEKKKCCMRFVYNMNDKKRALKKLENMINLKNENELNIQKELAKEDMKKFRYMNVENFRQSKIDTANKSNTILNKKIKYEQPIKRNHKNSVIKYFFNNIHPAFIRLQNRKLFNKYFSNLYRSEKFREKIPAVKKRHKIKIKKPQCRRIKKYKKIQILKKACMTRY
ncbi:conserved protein, unknown function, partial [Hepatocystis sp. ex Piliocolobus tephrosceles]